MCPLTEVRGVLGTAGASAARRVGVPSLPSAGAQEQRGRAAGLLDAAGGGRGGITGRARGTHHSSSSTATTACPPTRPGGSQRACARGAAATGQLHRSWWVPRPPPWWAARAEFGARSDWNSHYSSSMIIGESCSRLLHCVEPRGRLCGGGSLQKSLRHTWCLQIERWLLRLAGSSRPGTEDASHSSRMRFLRFWALFGAWRTIDFEKTRESSSFARLCARHC